MNDRFKIVFVFCLCVAVSGFVSCSDGSNSGERVSSDGGNGDSSLRAPEVVPKSVGYAAICPGAAGCLSNTGELKVGASAVSIAPEKFEVARWAYFSEREFCPEPTPDAPYKIRRCGVLDGNASGRKRDCGRDGVCKGEKLKTKIKCGQDKSCPAGLTCNESSGRCLIVYQGPDKDGSEKDGLPDWFLDCGRDRVCPCIDPQGKPSYFGKGKKCLVGDKPNPDYKGPDADGSEGDGEFQGIWMGGYNGNHPLQGIHDKTWARTIVFQTGETTVAIVSLDVVGFFFDDVAKARDAVMKRLKPGTVDYVLVTSTHTHEGPDTMGQWGPTQSGVPYKTGVSLTYQKFIIDRIVQSVEKAYAERKPATLRVGEVQTGGKGFVKDNRDPVIIDDTLRVLQAVAKGGATIATFVNWSNHPETLADGNNYLSSDYCHYVREALEKGVPAKGKAPEIKAQGGVAIFAQGAIGGIIVPGGVDVPDLDGTLQTKDDWARARALGHQIALRTQKALEQAKNLEQTKISLWAKSLKIKVENRAFHLAFSLGYLIRAAIDYNPDLPINSDNLPSVRSEIALVRVGPITFYTMPGELDPQVLLGGYDGSHSLGYPLIDEKKNPGLKEEMKSKAPKGPYLKEKIPGTYKFFLGLGNDQVGYLLSPWNFKLNPKNPYYDQAEGDHYTETNSVGPQVVPFLLQAYDELLSRAK